MVKKLVLFVMIMLLVVQVTGCSNGAKISEKMELGNKYLLEQNYEQAIIAFNEAIEIDPKAYEAYQGLYQVYIAQGLPADAEKILLTGIDAVTDKDAIRVILGDFYYYQNEYEKAVAVYDQITDGYSISKESISYIIMTYRTANMPEKAIRYAEQILGIAETKKEKFLALYDLGNIYGDVGMNVYFADGNTIDESEETKAEAKTNFEKAKGYFDSALQNAESNVEKYMAFDRLAWVNGQLENTGEEITNAQNALELAATNEEKYQQYSYIANGYDNQGDSAKAIEYYKLALNYSATASENDKQWIIERISRE